MDFTSQKCNSLANSNIIFFYISLFQKKKKKKKIGPFLFESNSRSICLIIIQMEIEKENERLQKQVENLEILFDQVKFFSKKT